MVRRARLHSRHLYVYVWRCPAIIDLACFMGRLVRAHDASARGQLLLGATGVHVEVADQKSASCRALAHPLPQLRVLGSDGAGVLHVCNHHRERT